MQKGDIVRILDRPGLWVIESLGSLVWVSRFTGDTISAWVSVLDCVPLWTEAPVWTCYEWQVLDACDSPIATMPMGYVGWPIR